MTQIQPVLAALQRHKLIAWLLAALVALTCAIVTNVAFVLMRQAAQMRLPSGIAENQVVTIRSSNLNRKADQVAQHRADLMALRTIPGVESAAAVDSLPLNENNTSEGMCATEQALERSASANSLGGGCAEISIYNGTPGLAATLGVRFVEGRDFREDEFENTTQKRDPPAVIITRALADRLYPDGKALGKSLYADPHQPMRIVGVVANVLRPYLVHGGKSYDDVFWPVRPHDATVTYVLRTAPADRARVLKQAKTVLFKINPDRIVDHARTFTQIRASYFRTTRTMVGLLVASALGLLFVAAIGIVGLTSFWVQERTHTIGIRRALGATRHDILRYFQTENFLIVTLGVVMGVLAAIGLNLLLMAHYELPRLPLWYLAIGAVVLWILGQLAVLAPALRASYVSPAMATRSV